MTAKPRIQLCDACRLDNGWHYDLDENNEVVATRPHHDQLVTLRQAHAMTEQAHAEQTKQAREIVRHAAETLSEFSANAVRDQMETAQIEGPLVGAAFAWAREQGLIEQCGFEQSTDPATRHRVAVWRSIAPSVVAS